MHEPGIQQCVYMCMSEDIYAKGVCVHMNEFECIGLCRVSVSEPLCVQAFVCKSRHGKGVLGAWICKPTH